MTVAGDREFPASGTTSPPGPGQPEEAIALLLRLFVGLRRGMAEFRHAYGLGDPESHLDSLTPAEILERMCTEGVGGEARIAVARGVEELMIHHAALLEAYQAATQHGSRAILDSLDPEMIRSQVEAGKVRVGPLTLPVRFPPVLMQAVWEAFLRRFAELRRLDPADFERFYREGFREGYRAFRAARGPREG